MEDVLAPTVIERAMSVFENLKERDHGEVSQSADVAFVWLDRIRANR
jgi:hypothetical protein